MELQNIIPELASNKGHNKGVITGHWAYLYLKCCSCTLHSVDNDPNDHVKILRNIVSGQFKIPVEAKK